MAVADKISEFMCGLEHRNPHEPEFIQAVHEVVEAVMPLVLDNPDYQQAQILERMTEPDRIISFRVSWEDDNGCIRANRGWRVQFNSAIGPYKGGLRFHKSVNQSVFKFLGFEQTFKNSLTGLPMGGAKGGANFNPKDKSEREIMRFCHSFMTELHRHIGPHTDVPAGDIGVGSREIGYLFGQYKRLLNEYEGVLTGKGLAYGGSAVRKEATGYGVLYLLEDVLNHHDKALDQQRIAISGSGNVALYAAQKAMEVGARVLTLSDSNGFIYAKDGFDESLWEAVRQLKEEQRGRLADLDSDAGAFEYYADKKPWAVPCDIAMPCATQNEMDEDDAKTLVDNDTHLVIEGANMPLTAEAVACVREQGLIFVPGKAANAGGVAVSGLEQSQNAARLSWSHDQVNSKLREIMTDIHKACVAESNGDGNVDYWLTANRAGFRKVAEAMLAYGVV